MSDKPIEIPTFEVVYAYADKTVDFFIQKSAKWLNREHKEEIRQEAFMRVAEAYKKLDPNKGWKSFMQLHCQGAVLDYLKLGRGHIEDGDVSDDLYDGLKTRVNIQSENGVDFLGIDEVLALNGINSESTDQTLKLNVRWDLLSRMSGQDDDLHIVAKVILGFAHREIAEQFRLIPGAQICRERISQRFYEFFEQLDNAYGKYDPWLNQCIYALGISEYYHENEIDNGVGWDLKAFNLRDPYSFKKTRKWREKKKVKETRRRSLTPQLSLFERAG